MSVSGVGGSSAATYSSATNKSAEEEEEEKAAVEDKEETEAGSASGADASSSADSSTAAENLAAYKKKVLAQLQSSMNKPYLAHVSLNLNISDAGFKRMMTDADYEKSVMSAFEKQTAHNYFSIEGTLTLTADGEDDNTSATLTRAEKAGRRFFNASDRSAVRAATLDSLSALALGTIENRQTTVGKFEIASAIGQRGMMTTSNYINAYMQQAGLLDTTG